MVSGGDELRWRLFSGGGGLSGAWGANHSFDYLAQPRRARTADAAIRASIDSAQDLNIKEASLTACANAPFLNRWPSWKRRVISQMKKIPGQKIRKNAVSPKVLLWVSHMGTQAKNPSATSERVKNIPYFTKVARS